MLPLSTLAFGSIMLGKEQNGGAALTAVSPPGDTGSHNFSGSRASAQELRLLWLNFSEYPLLAGFKVCSSACALQCRYPLARLFLLNGPGPSMA